MLTVFVFVNIVVNDDEPPSIRVGLSQPLVNIGNHLVAQFPLQGPGNICTISDIGEVDFVI